MQRKRAKPNNFEILIKSIKIAFLVRLVLVNKWLLMPIFSKPHSKLSPIICRLILLLLFSFFAWPNPIYLSMGNFERVWYGE